MRSLLSLFILALSLTAWAPAASAQVVEAEEIPQDQAAADSLAAVCRDSLFNVALESYKNVKFLRLEDTPQNDFYTAVYQCYEVNMEALPLQEKNTQPWRQCKSMLMDINAYIEEGAFYYSSIGNSEQLTRFAQAFIDTQQQEDFVNDHFNRNEASFPTMVYIAASGAYNAKEYERAIRYFNLYLSTGEIQHREQVSTFLGQAYLNTGMYDNAVSSLMKSVNLYPTNYYLLTLALQACIDGGYGENMQMLLDRALTLKPEDEQLLNIQGKLYEDEQNYDKALEIYTRLDRIKPQNLTIAKHIALCYYNLGVKYFNMSIMEEDEKTLKKYKRQSNDYFFAAIDRLQEILANDPMAVKYMQALAISYSCIDNPSKVRDLNEKIVALGGNPVSEVRMPPTVGFNENDAKNFARTETASFNPADGIPTYSEFAKEYVTVRLTTWAEKGEFEKLENYQTRVNDATIKREYDRLCRQAEQEYIRQYAGKLRLNDLTLMPYDANNEVYLIESGYGPIYLNVPMRNNEAEMFKANWNNVRFQVPRFYVKDDKVQIASITFVAPGGRTYSYNAANHSEYADIQVDIDYESILRSHRQESAQNVASRANDVKVTVKSDVDENIPVTRKVASNTVALIIANEDYQHVSKVQSALHDGEVFSQYCQLTLGLPKENIRFYQNATLGSMLKAMNDVRNIVKSINNKVDVIVYYAGHGMPDEGTKDAFLLPVDGDAMISASCYSLNKFYSELSEMGANSVMVFVDACFSGAQRDGSMLMSARGVAIKAKPSEPRGNMFILSAADGQETALPYAEKNHGLFTYYLLKKLQDSKGNVTLKELSDYVIENVKRQSNLINQKPQTPNYSLSGSMRNDWTKVKLRP